MIKAGSTIELILFKMPFPSGFGTLPSGSDLFG
jgi:hypothetical protein